MTALPNIVALSGFMGAGKTEAGKVLIAEFGYERVRFAGPLKAMLRALGLNSEQVDGDQKEVPSELLCGLTPRHAMQTLGTEWGRGCMHSNLWVEAWKAAVNDKKRVVVDDIRFPNEAEAVKSLGGVIWRVERPGVGPSDHASESQAIGHDTLVYNEGDKADLRNAVVKALGRSNFWIKPRIVEDLTGPMGRS